MARSDNRKKVQDYILKIMGMIDKSGTNKKYWENKFKPMSDTKFDDFMKGLQSGKRMLYIVAPNMKVNLKMEDMLAAAKASKTKLFHKLVLKDEKTGKTYVTNEEYPVFNLPVRRLQQYIDKKLSVPDSDTSIDGLTGQVVGDDKSASLTYPETQALFMRGLKTTLTELLKVRGGDIHAYSDFKHMMEETGSAELEALAGDTRTRSAIVMSNFFKGMHLDMNI